ncbi:unnamed protein product [Alopecurus aequalis]
MSSWNVDTATFTDLLQSDGSQTPHVDDLSPTHRRSNVGSSPLPRVLYSSGTAPPGQYGPYGPPPGPYGSYPPPSYPYPQPPPPHAPPSYPYAAPTYPYAAPYGSYPPPPPEVSALSSGSDAAETVLPQRPKRLDWTISDEEKLAHAWIFNSKDSKDGNCKTDEGFWAQIAKTYNETSEPARHRTPKQLKDHWNVYNREVSLFNSFHIQEEGLRPSGADDDMVMKAALARYANDTRLPGSFRREHWWKAVRNESKWKRQHGPGSGSDTTSKRTRLGVSGEYSSSEATEEEERPTGRDRAKAAARKDKGKRKGKESSSSSTEVASKSFAMKNMMQGLVKAKLLKQWNKMRDRSTADMDEQDKRKHVKALRIVEKELGLEDDDDDEEED